MTPAFEIVEPDPKIYAEIARRFDAHNRALTSWDWTSYSIVVREGEHVAASARGVTNMGLVEIRGVWIDPDRRGSGLGQALVREVEAEAMRRGCTAAALDTYSWQAPGFYRKLGYVEFGRLDYPNGTSRHYLRKALGA
ncbi:MAG: GNAT family N-acetyltransferase [Pseudomonadota bacterium]